MEKFEKTLDFVVNTVVSGVAAALIGLIFITINVEIVCRYVFNTSTLIADEYCGYLFAIAVYAGLSVGLHQDKLIKIDFPGAWSRFVKRPFIQIIVNLSAVLLNGILLYAILRTFSSSLLFGSRSIQVSRTPLVYPQGVVAACLALLFLVSVFQLARTILRLASPAGDKGESA